MRGTGSNDGDQKIEMQNVKFLNSLIIKKSKRYFWSKQIILWMVGQVTINLNY